LLVFLTLAVLNAVWSADDNCFVHNHLLIVPSDGHIAGWS
jgi:hypothetical protein